MAAMARTNSIIFAFSVFTGISFLVELRLGERSLRPERSKPLNRLVNERFL